jgi:hypothetical protein
MSGSPSILTLKKPSEPSHHLYYFIERRRERFNKITSVTGRHNRPMMLFLKGTMLLYSQIVAGIFNLQSLDACDI